MKNYENPYWKIYRWFRWDAKHFHRDVIQGFKNLWRWLPIVWKDRDWDHHFIFEVLKFKIKNTANLTKKNQRFVGWESQVRYMTICEKLITLIQDEYYSNEYFDYYDNKFSFEKIEDSDNFEMKSEVTRDDLQSYINKYPNTKRFVMNHPKYSKFIDPISKATDSRLAMVMGIARHEKAKKLLFKILEQKIENWWD